MGGSETTPSHYSVLSLDIKIHLTQSLKANHDWIKQQKHVETDKNTNSNSEKENSCYYKIKYRLEIPQTSFYKLDCEHSGLYTREN